MIQELPAAGEMTTADRASVPETLKAFIGSNMPLLTTFMVVAGLTGFALTLGLDWFGPVLRVGLLATAVIVWFELLAQIPAPLLLVNLRRYPSDYSWRFVWFAYLIQSLMVAFIVAMVVAFPRLTAPIVATAVAIAAVTRLPEAINGLLRLAIVALVFEVAITIFSPEHQSVLGWLLGQFR